MFFGGKKIILKATKAKFDKNNGHFLLFYNEKSWKITLACQKQKLCYIVNY